MSETKHTPVPWCVSGESVRDADGHRVCTVDSPADRALIAAAPDLLAALEAFADWEEKVHGSSAAGCGGALPPGECSLCQLVDDAGAAIAKATNGVAQTATTTPSA